MLVNSLINRLPGKELMPDHLPKKCDKTTFSLFRTTDIFSFLNFEILMGMEKNILMFVLEESRSITAYLVP